MKLRNKYTCSLELTHDIIRGKWKPIIIKGAVLVSGFINENPMNEQT